MILLDIAEESIINVAITQTHHILYWMIKYVWNLINDIIKQIAQR